MNFKIKPTLILITFFIGLSSASLASAAFPTIAASNSGNSGGNATSHTVNLPTGISSGNLLIVSFSNDGSATVTWPSGWTQLFSTVNGTNNILSVAYRIADGSEGTTITVGTSGNESSAHTSYRITGHDSSTAPAYGTAATDSSANPNPPSLTPAWGAADTLWLSVYGWDSNATNSSYPTNYTLGQVTNLYNHQRQGTGIASAGYNLNASSQDPGTATLSVTKAWVANTLAIRPFVASTITLATGTDPSGATVAPGSGIRDAGAFTLQSSSGADSVTALTVTLAGSGTPYEGIGEISITSNDGATTYFSAVSNPSSNTVNFSGGTAIPITTTQTQFKIRITPKTHANMPVPAGASYDLSPYVSDWTLANANNKTGSDSNANTLTIDNASPNGATSTSGTGGTGNVALNWTTSSSTDFSRSVILRWASSTPGSEVPAEGTDYTAGNTISTATVACVRTADSASTAITDAVNGNGGGGGCSTTALTNGTAYSYKVFQKDSNGNYDTGVTFTGSPFTVTSGTVTQIFRSVGPGATGALASNTSPGTNTITISNTNSTVTFVTGLADNIGVGDAIVYDSDNDNTLTSADSIAFIHGRTSSTVYTIKTHTGGTPTDLSANDTWAIYRAYTSLANAEAGTKNTSIPITFNGGNRDLVTNNEQWNIACYANGTTADTTAVTVDGWATDSDNFIKIYTPVSSTEVGVSQRHGGKWDDGKYKLAVIDNTIIINENRYTKIDGLQLSSVGTAGSYTVYLSNALYTEFSGNIVRNQNSGSSLIAINSSSGGYFYNNIIYDFSASGSYGFYANWTYDNMLYWYNNTVYNCYYGFYDGGGATWQDGYVINNIAVNCGSDCFYDEETSGWIYNYNISSDGTADDYGGTGNKSNQIIFFLDEAGYDFHLAQTDTSARGAGANLTADANLPFSTDIDGQLRNPSGAGWDIGADEGTVEFVSTVMQSGGNFSTLSSWEDAIDSDLVANTTRVFAHGGITGTIVGGNTVTGLTSGATATVVYSTSTQILLHTVNGIFQSGETMQVSAGNSVVISDNGNPASAVAKIDGAWTVADTTAVDIFGWTSGPDNYIKIYTTPTARHSGKWDTGKYRLGQNVSGGYLVISDNYTIVDGIQIQSRSVHNNIGISIFADEAIIKNNIIKDINTGIYVGYTLNAYIYNNLIYNVSFTALYIHSYAESYIYGNTLVTNVNNVEYPISSNALLLNFGSNQRVINNITQGFTVFKSGTGGFHSSSDYNITDTATASGGVHDKASTTVSFVSTTAGSEDFHLSQSDTAAKNAGTDLSTYFSTDIDGASRNSSINAWDIGADETATQIYRSVGPSATGLLDSDNSHADELLSITSGVATFEVGVADNIGVGDVLIYDSDASDSITSADTLLFIHGRTDSTHYLVRTHTGAVPANVAATNDTWNIYRAYTSLANAEAGTINSALSGMGFAAFNGGNRDLMTNNEEWNIACYANGTTADTVNVVIADWDTGAYNYLKIYTPVSINEVGVSQRHRGRRDDNYYNIKNSLTSYSIYSQSMPYVEISGLQVLPTNTSGWVGGIRATSPAEGSYIKVHDNIIAGLNPGNAYDEYFGIHLYEIGGGISRGDVYNNIVYNFKTSNNHGFGIYNQLDNAHVYNNTVYNSDKGIVGNWNFPLLKNNIVQDCTDGYYIDGAPSWNASSDYNISDLASDAPSPSYRSGLATDVTFVDEANDDFHLSQTDPYARNFGTNLSADSNLSFSTDIDGATRTSVTAWDIGADETATRIFRSVGPSATGLLTSDTAHARTVTLTSGVATFSVGLPDNIGVGDAVLIDTNNDEAITSADTLLFIHSRTSSTSYTLRTHTGATPSDISINDTYQIYRAYTSLANAEAGTKNTSIPIAFNGGNRDLVTNNEEWNIACYANGTTADTTAVTIYGWITAQQNFVKVYTPVNSNEVGVSQRHSGKEDLYKYYLSNSVGSAVRYLYFDGLQLILSGKGAFTLNKLDSYKTYISNCFMKSDGNGSGIFLYNSSGMVRAWNNVIIGFYNGVYTNRGGNFFNNNTIVNSFGYGISQNNGLNANNNLIVGSILANYLSESGVITGYNNLSSDGTSYGTNPIINANVQFVNEAGYDFHLAQTDTAARGAGANLTAEIATSEYLLAMTKDIDGQLRNPSGAGWDIGADEGTVEFVSTVMQSGGNFSTLSSWEDAIDSDLVADTTRVFSHGGITGTIVGGNTVTGLTSGATATVVYSTSTQILLHTVSGIFQSGETVQVSSGNSVVISDNGNPASAVAKIDGVWTAADTTAVTVNGWATGHDNYIKIYTTSAARHSGKWDMSRYNLSTTINYYDSLYIAENFVVIDGLQFSNNASLGTSAVININQVSTSDSSNINISNIIISKSKGDGIYQGSGKLTLWNSIIYGNDKNGFRVGYYYNNPTSYIYNSTIVNNGEYGIIKVNHEVIRVNNCYIGGNVLGGFSFGDGVIDALSSNNISSDATAPGTNSKINTTVSFVSTTPGAEDFHLSQSDTAAKNAGTDLSTYFTTDIDGATRTSVTAWDIGADETATQIFRSVGPSATGLLDSDNSHADLLNSITSGVATFEVAVADNIGVGDVLIVDTNNDETITSADTLLFISGRNSSTSYNLQANDGSIPGDIPINDTWQIYRAHTSLANAEAGTINSTLSAMGFTFNGGNRDLMTNNEEWNIACYANGTTADSTGVDINGWNMGASNFIKIFTPLSSNEVGVSQRHTGKWSSNVYFRDEGIGIEDSISYVIVDGMQISRTTSGTWAFGLLANDTIDSGFIVFKNNIIKGILSGSASSNWGIFKRSGSAAIVNVYNNIVYDFDLVDNRGIHIEALNDDSVYNNTVYNCHQGIRKNGSMNVSNNIVQGGDGEDYYSVSGGVTANNNISSDGTAWGTNSKINTTVSFIDETNDDFHLSQSDTSAKDAGTDLSTYFSTDIDGATRNSSINNWDIGADETATRIFRSVGPSATGLLDSDNSHADELLSITSGVATFEVALPDNIGVGDALIYDSNASETITSADTLLFIHGRTDSTHYTVRTQTGAIPSDVATTNDTWQIYRAYTSLFYAEAGTKNTSIPITFNGGNRDLITNNEEWNIACYENGNNISGGVDIRDWNTGQQNFVKYYTPTDSSEVGVSQRHQGRSGTGFQVNGSMSIYENFVWLDGISLSYTTTRGFFAYNIGGGVGVGEIRISNCFGTGSFNVPVIYFEVSPVFMTYKVWNNILVKNGENDWVSGIRNNSNSELYAFNNTVVVEGVASAVQVNGVGYLKNNLIKTNGGVGIYKDPASTLLVENCATSDGTADNFGGTGNKVNQTFEFVNEAGKDFHLAQTDTAARGAGANLTAEIATSEYLLAMTRDVDGQLRNPAGAGWDIGADEGTVEFVSTVMQSGGNFSTLSSWEDAIDSDLVADTTRVFAHGGITGTIVGGNTVTGLTSGATATVVYATSAQILLHTVSGIFQSGETLQVTAGNSVVISDNGNPASAVAKIDGAWSVADTTAVYIDGWTSGPDNYIKIYTTPDARHNGKWDEGKYRRASYGYGGFGLSESFVIIDGLQLFGTLSGNFYPVLISISTNSRNSLIEISNNIFNADYSGLSGYPYNGYGIYQSPYGGYFKGNFYNNIFYNLKSPGGSFPVGLRGASINFYNNTIYNCDYTTQNQVSGILAKNNLISNTPYPFNGFTTGSDYNVTDTTAPIGSGTHNSINARIDFVSTTPGSEDLHIKETSYGVIDKGVNLSTDTSLSFNTDIDGTTRTGMWDAGADELPTQIYRSVGPGKTDALDNDTSHSKNVTLTGGVATFSAPIPDNVGVGDVVIIDTDNDEAITSADTLLFISKRNSSTTYQLQTHTGATPSDITINDTYQIYRAHTSLANAEAGTINSTLSGLGFTFNGGNRDLVANNEQWNIACYANGTTADTTAVTVDGWTTGPYNFLKVYTPVSATEVGESQRHGGKWDEGKYYLSTIDLYRGSMNIYSSYIFIDGIQIKYTTQISYGNLWVVSIGDANNGSGIKNSIITSIDAYSNNIRGIGIGDASGKKHYISNNIIYGSGLGEGIEVLYSGTAYVYNNTIHGATKGINLNSGAIFAKNNITQNCTDGYSGTFDASSDYNISDLASDAPGTNSKNSTNVLFLDEANDDFRLSSDDTAAKGAGLNLSTDANLSFFDDIRGQARPASPTAWSIGASEPQSAGKIKLEGTQIKMEGDAKFE